MSGAQPAKVSHARDFDLCDMRLVVAVVEGTVQIAFLADGWQNGPRKLLSNCFCDARTPDQLEAIAAHLRSLNLPEALGAA
jgi:hypothetical protein